MTEGVFVSRERQSAFVLLYRLYKLQLALEGDKTMKQKSAIIGYGLLILIVISSCSEKADQTSTGRQPVGEETRIRSPEEMSNKVIPPQKGEKFEIDIKTYAEVLEDQILPAPRSSPASPSTACRTMEPAHCWKR